MAQLHCACTLARKWTNNIWKSFFVNFLFFRAARCRLLTRSLHHLSFHLFAVFSCTLLALLFSVCAHKLPFNSFTFLRKHLSWGLSSAVMQLLCCVRYALHHRPCIDFLLSFRAIRIVQYRLLCSALLRVVRWISAISVTATARHMPTYRSSAEKQQIVINCKLQATTNIISEWRRAYRQCCCRFFSSTHETSRILLRHRGCNTSRYGRQLKWQLPAGAWEQNEHKKMHITPDPLA